MTDAKDIYLYQSYIPPDGTKDIRLEYAGQGIGTLIIRTITEYLGQSDTVNHIHGRVRKITEYLGSLDLSILHHRSIFRTIVEYLGLYDPSYTRISIRHRLFVEVIAIKDRSHSLNRLVNLIFGEHPKQKIQNESR